MIPFPRRSSDLSRRSQRKQFSASVISCSIRLSDNRITSKSGQCLAKWGSHSRFFTWLLHSDTEAKLSAREPSACTTVIRLPSALNYSTLVLSSGRVIRPDRKLSHKFTVFRLKQLDQSGKSDKLLLLAIKCSSRGSSRKSKWLMRL